MKDYLKILDQNEKIVWEDKERFWPRYVFVILKLLGTYFLAFILIGIIWFISTLGRQPSGEFPSKLMIFITSLYMLCILYLLLLYQSTRYIITSKRIITRFGVFFSHFKMADLDNIRNVNLKINFTDKLAGNNTGNVIISTSTANDIVFGHIKNCYEILKQLKAMSYDIKTDINYPNEYRPEKNSGYKTEYKPKR